MMRDLPRCHYDLLLTDPPYAMPATYYTGANTKRRWSDTLIMNRWWQFVMQQAKRILKENAQVGVFVKGEAMMAFWPVLYELGRVQIVVWDKNSVGPGWPFRNTVEFIVACTIGNPEVAPGAGKPSVLSHSRVPPPSRIHPAQKPHSLLVDLVGAMCPEGGRVLDPFAGSFSTEAACDSLGLECTSIEWGEAFAMPADQTELFSP